MTGLKRHFINLGLPFLCRTFSELFKPADLYKKCEELCESLADDLYILSIPCRTFSELSKPADLYKKCEELCESLADDLYILSIP